MSLFNEGIAYTMYIQWMQPNWAMRIHRRRRVLTKKLEKVLKKPNSNQQKQNKTNKI